MPISVPELIKKYGRAIPVNESNIGKINVGSSTDRPFVTTTPTQTKTRSTTPTRTPTRSRTPTQTPTITPTPTVEGKGCVFIHVEDL